MGAERGGCQAANDAPIRRGNRRKALLRRPHAHVRVRAAQVRVRAIPMQSLILLLVTVIDLYMWAIIIWVILSWLVVFNVINTQNRFVAMVGDFLNRITEPALRPIRRFVPNLGGVDLSPLILILLLYFAKNLIFEYLAPRAY